jgi:5-methylcytosine-specific restriction endonuclease McrA
MRAYQAAWMAKRRAGFFADKSCAACGSRERLELDHVDPSKKTSHSIWSWSPERREAEIAKCQVLCRPCHQLKSIDDLAAMRLAGRKVVSTKLTEDDVRAIRAEAARGVSLRTLGMRFGVDKTAIHKVVARKRWRHVA